MSDYCQINIIHIFTVFIILCNVLYVFTHVHILACHYSKYFCISFHA